MRTLQAAAIGFFLLGVTNALAWNEFGHMTVAAIAYDHLTPSAQAKVAALLKLNPNYNKWTAGVPKKERTRVAFILAATWPDFIKHAPGYQNDGNRPSDPGAGQNIGYQDKLQHRYWHFIDLPFSPDGTPLVDPVTPNAKSQIALFRETLHGSTASDEVKSYDLVWVLHLVGDVHQPLHATSRFDKDQPTGDNGGNLVALCAHPCKNELHAFWDEALGTSLKPTDAVKKAAKMKSADAQLASIRDEATWIDESFHAAQDAVYVSPVGVGAGPFTLDATYKTAARELAAKRVALAGARLANLLNDALK